MAERKSFLLRMDPALWAELEGWAAQELRSVNGQIEWLLRQAVERRKGQKAEGEGEAGVDAGRKNDQVRRTNDETRQND
jgi:hypothetical protein